MADNIQVTRSSMPDFEEYCEEIKKLWDSHWLTNMGVEHKLLQSELESYLACPHVILYTNGHLALENVIAAMQFPKGSEVITTPFTFVSTTHAISRNGLVPVFCDVNPSDYTIDVDKIEALITEKTVAIVPVHVYGNMCDVERIAEIAKKYSLKVIYDAAHAFAVKYKGVSSANFGDASMFSFHATKVFNTIEGGAVTFHDHWIYEKLYNLKNFGIRGETLVTEVGANAKMNELCAIMGLCNLKHIGEAIESRKHVFDYYMSVIGKIDGIDTFRIVKSEEVNNYAYFPILIRENYPISRDELYDKMCANGVFPRKYFYPITSDQNCFRNKYKMMNLQNARDLSHHVLTIPIYEGMSNDDLQRITDLLEY